MLSAIEADVRDIAGKGFFETEEAVQAEVERRLAGQSSYRMQRTIIDGVASEWEPY